MKLIALPIVDGGITPTIMGLVVYPTTVYIWCQRGLPPAREAVISAAEPEAQT